MRKIISARDTPGCWSNSRVDRCAAGDRQQQWLRTDRPAAHAAGGVQVWSGRVSRSDRAGDSATETEQSSGVDDSAVLYRDRRQVAVGVGNAVDTSEGHGVTAPVRISWVDAGPRRCDRSGNHRGQRQPDRHRCIPGWVIVMRTQENCVAHQRGRDRERVPGDRYRRRGERAGVYACPGQNIRHVSARPVVVEDRRLNVFDLTVRTDMGSKRSPQPTPSLPHRPRQSRTRRAPAHLTTAPRTVPTLR